jgi:ATP-dependent RNA helicase DDX20
MSARARTEDVRGELGSFRDLLLPEPLVKSLEAAGYTKPSPVQQQAIPLGRLGADLIVQAKSGTGKTVVFSTVCLDRLDAAASLPQALIVAPTRELALQSCDVLGRLAAALPEPHASVAAFVGGLPIINDEKRLRRTCHVVVGTPGRLVALAQNGSLQLGSIKLFVLDEADQLLAEAFYPDVTWLYDQLPKRKQVRGGAPPGQAPGAPGPGRPRSHSRAAGQQRSAPALARVAVRPAPTPFRRRPLPPPRR